MSNRNNNSLQPNISPNKDIPNKITTKHEVVGIAQEFCGPIPPPNLLEGYENVHAGAADRIIQMAEKEQSHRHKIELMGYLLNSGFREKCTRYSYFSSAINQL